MATDEKKPTRGWFRKTLLQLEIGALAGLIAWALVGGSIVSWRYKPVAAEAISCAPSVNAALADYTKFQLLAAAGGAGVVVLLAGLGRRKKPPVSSPT